MKGYLDFDRIEELSAIDGESTRKNLASQVIKLQEETGEVASAFLAYVGAENASGSSLEKVNLHHEVLEEVIDTMIVCADIINSMVEDEDLEAMKDLVDRKLLKWSSKLSNIEARKKETLMEEFIK